MIFHSVPSHCLLSSGPKGDCFSFKYSKNKLTPFKLANGNSMRSSLILEGGGDSGRRGLIRAFSRGVASNGALRALRGVTGHS